jgi:tetratricopeptide (TPR) repeat protein
MPIEGPLKEMGIHDIFQLLDLSRKTGRLTATSKLRHNSGNVYFENGSVVYAEIESNPHLLGNMLVSSGKISEGDLNRARDMQEKGDNRRLGEILVDIGALSQRDLERQVRFQVEEVIFELVGWREGYFSFVEGERSELPPEALVKITTESLLMEGARRIDEWSLIERKIPHLGVIPKFSPLDPGEKREGYLDLLPSEWELLGAVDSDRDVRGVATALGRSEFEVAKAIFGLESAGILMLHEPTVAQAEDTESEEDIGRLLQRAEEAVVDGDMVGARSWAEVARSTSPHDARVHLTLGTISLAADEAESAEENLRRALRIDPMLVRAHRLLGNALALQGRYSEAVEWWQRWLKLGEHTEEEEAEIEKVRDALKAVDKLDALLGKASE